MRQDQGAFVQRAAQARTELNLPVAKQLLGRDQEEGRPEHGPFGSRHPLLRLRLWGSTLEVVVRPSLVATRRCLKQLWELRRLPPAAEAGVRDQRQHDEPRIEQEARREGDA